MDPYFFQLLDEMRPKLARVFGTANPFTIAISGTGSAGMEAAVANFVEPGDTFAVFANGFFCDRISEMGRRHGARVARLEKPWGETFSAAEAADFLRREKPQVVAYVQAETSTGAFQDGRAICAAAREIDALVIADCVTSLGGMPVRVDETGIDIAYSCSQKGLGCPPGLAPLTVSPRALDRLMARKSPAASWYLDLRLLKEYFDPPHKYHHTAPISMFYALREALAIIDGEGLENRWERHHRNHLAFVAGLEAMGLSLHVPKEHRLWTLHTPRVPAGIDESKLRRRLLDEHGIEILGGFGPLAGKVFRIGLMGAGSEQHYVLLLLEALESALRAEGYHPHAGGKEAAEHAFAAPVH
jgi:alanine-glyoxylate transaminase/serine-glyoxylate transaminase/serine-pyruvate transaminase